MQKILYECYDTSIIEELPCSHPAQFSTVETYASLYKKELPRFRKNPLQIYGLPCFDVPSHIYLGLGRMGLCELEQHKLVLSKEQKEIQEKIEKNDYNADNLMLCESDAVSYLSLCKDADNYELIWSRISGSDENIPPDYHFLGYDITYPAGCDGAFSMICDCLFICRWHGCDEEGTLFSEDFSKLNKNGLFNDWTSAHDYMIKYLNADWSERGRYIICEIYGK